MSKIISGRAHGPSEPDSRHSLHGMGPIPHQQTARRRLQRNRLLLVSWTSNCSCESSRTSVIRTTRVRPALFSSTARTITSCDQETPESNVHCASHSFGRASAQRVCSSKSRLLISRSTERASTFTMQHCSCPRASTGEFDQQTLNTYTEAPWTAVVQALGDQMSAQIEQIPSGRMFMPRGRPHWESQVFS